MTVRTAPSFPVSRTPTRASLYRLTAVLMLLSFPWIIIKNILIVFYRQKKVDIKKVLVSSRFLIMIWVKSLQRKKANKHTIFHMKRLSKPQREKKIRKLELIKCDLQIGYFKILSLNSLHLIYFTYQIIWVVVRFWI